ncbi:MAG: RrF2 family transcriptional regulator [Planctomycetota bacterium]|jgi:Rrf2 family protein
MITREADYSLRVVLHLSECQTRGERCSVAELSSILDIPRHFLRTIVRKLVKENILISFKGNQGGVELARPSSEITMLDVLRAISANSCLLNTCLGENSSCSRMKKCQIHSSLTKMQKILDGKMSEITFDQLVD